MRVGEETRVQVPASVIKRNFSQNDPIVIPSSSSFFQEIKFEAYLQTYLPPKDGVRSDKIRQLVTSHYGVRTIRALLFSRQNLIRGNGLQVFCIEDNLPNCHHNGVCKSNFTKLNHSALLGTLKMELEPQFCPSSWINRHKFFIVTTVVVYTKRMRMRKISTSVGGAWVLALPLNGFFFTKFAKRVAPLGPFESELIGIGVGV